MNVLQLVVVAGAGAFSRPTMQYDTWSVVSHRGQLTRRAPEILAVDVDEVNKAVRIKVNAQEACAGTCGWHLDGVQLRPYFAVAHEGIVSFSGLPQYPVVSYLAVGEDTPLLLQVIDSTGEVWPAFPVRIKDLPTLDGRERTTTRKVSPEGSWVLGLLGGLTVFGGGLLARRVLFGR